MSDLSSLRTLAGEISEEGRIHVASCRHFCYRAGPICFLPVLMHGAASAGGTPLTRFVSFFFSFSQDLARPLEARPPWWHSGRQGEEGEPLGPRSTPYGAHQPPVNVKGQEKGVLVVWMTSNELHHTVKRSVCWASRPRFLIRFCSITRYSSAIHNLLC